MVLLPPPPPSEAPSFRLPVALVLGAAPASAALAISMQRVRNATWRWWKASTAAEGTSSSQVHIS